MKHPGCWHAPIMNKPVMLLLMVICLLLSRKNGYIRTYILHTTASLSEAEGTSVTFRDILHTFRLLSVLPWFHPILCKTLGIKDKYWVQQPYSYMNILLVFPLFQVRKWNRGRAGSELLSEESRACVTFDLSD